MTRFAVAESVEQESSSRTFFVGVILFLAWRVMATYWSQIATGLLRPEVLSGLVGVGAGAAALALWLRAYGWQQSSIGEVLEAPAEELEETQQSPEEEAEIVEHLAQSFEEQLGKELESRLGELPPLWGDSPLDLSFRWSRRSWVANSVWEKVEPALRRRMDKAGLSMDAQSRLESRVRLTTSALLVRPDLAVDGN
jgi:hypothetical protein